MLTAMPEPSANIDPAVREAARLVAAGEAEAGLKLLAPIVADPAAGLAPRFVLAMAGWRIGRLDWAVALLRECHAAWPMVGEVAEVLASLHAQSGNFVDSVYMGKLATALGSIGPLAELVPPDFPSFAWAILNIKERPLLAEARQHLASGQFEQAVAKAHQHVALSDGDGEAVAFCAAALLRLGQAGGAVAALAAIEAEAARAAPIASLYGKALAAQGEFAAAQHWHRHAVALSPTDAAIAAAEIADAIWLENDVERIAAAGAAWVDRFSQALPAPAPAPRDGKLVVAYLVSALADPGDAAAIATVARAHDRSRVHVVGYGAGQQSWLENAALSGAFDVWRDISTLDAATLARFLARDAVDIVVDACGFRAPDSLLALASGAAPVRVAWPGNVTALAEPVYEASLCGYPLFRPTAPLPRMPRSSLNFGTDSLLPQLDAKTVAMWSAILRGAPDARLLIRSADRSRSTIERLVARFSDGLAARIDLVTAARPEEFYALVDVALAPSRGASPRLAAEALGCGVPAVALAGHPAVEAYSHFLRALGIGPSLVASDVADYVGIALGLVRAPDERARLAAAVTESAGDDAARLACSIEHLSRRAVGVRASL